MNSRLTILTCFLVPFCCNTLAGETSLDTLRIATFNVSIEATNYLPRKDVADDPSRAIVVSEHLASGNNEQISNVAQIIQRVRPDIILLNEFDFIADSEKGIELFVKNYLNVSQGNQPALDLPYFYIAPSNTGLSTAFDLDRNGRKTGVAGDAQGFGFYPGQYGMAILSRFPIDYNRARTMQNFLWKDMPNHLKPRIPNGEAWYSDEQWSQLRLSSKSHWDIPINTPKGVIHIIAAHPTPPTFDGSEDRNGKRNHDEIRFISDYLSSEPYIYDDQGRKGGIDQGSRFVVLGDLNSSPTEGESIKTGIKGLLDHALIDSSCEPKSTAGKNARPENQYAEYHTAAWGLRVDYALPSREGLTVVNCGLYWPTKSSPEYSLIADRKSSSDHRLVWVDVRLTEQ
ncbi:MAG: endonuclease/exonuclease/phosphatase family protein [Gammaproteobacteria bacterium]|nr:endonuclease/exonuclease/phosphatase family protein [Gammaproteobacteria bacterium]